MKKSNAAIAGTIILFAAALTLIFAFTQSNRKTPDFVFSEPSSLISAAGSDGSEEGLREDPLPAETAEETAVAEETREGLPSIITSNNPKLRSEITFDGFDIIIRGECEDKYIISACLYSDGEEEAAVYDGDNYGIVLKDKHVGVGYDSVYIYTDDEVMSYRVRAAADGFEPIDTADIAENNLYLAENPVALPSEGVLQYITPDGDAEKAREVMEQVEEISDKICEGMTDDYDKAFAIFKWIAENIYYDYDASHSSVTTETLSLSHVLEVHRTVCGGFSNLFAALCAVQGIEVRCLRGDAINDNLSSYAETDEGNMHEWNYAVINGRGAWVDSCWGTYNYYMDGKYKYRGTSPKYFDITNDVLSYDHRAKVCETRNYFFN